MALWGNQDQADNSPLFTPAQFKREANTTSRNAMYANNTSEGVFGVDENEQAAGADVAHTGWVLRTKGSGSLASISIDNGGTGYANADTINIVSETGSNAAATMTTDGSGVITDVSLDDAGDGFTSKNPTVEITTSAGTGATLTATAGGRAGRVKTEVLVAGGITGDGSDDTVFPDA